MSGPGSAAMLSIMAAMAATAPAQAQDARYVLVVAPQSDTLLRDDAALKIVQTLAARLIQACGPLSVGYGFSPLPASFQGSADGGSPAALGRYRDTQTSIQVVPSISRCPVPPSPGGVFGGCTAHTGPVILRDYPATTTEARLRLAQKWAHEIGHGQGLIGNVPGYVGGHNPAEDALMFWSAGENRWGASSFECARLYAVQAFPPPQVGAIVDGAPEAAPTDLPLTEIVPQDEAASPEPADTAEPDDDFLRGDWMQPLAIERIEADRERLLPLAERAIDEDRVTLWPGSVIVVAYAGQSGAATRLAKVLTAGPDGGGIEPGSDAAFQLNEARIRAAGALSYVIYREAAGDYQGEDAPLARDLLDSLLDPARNLDLPLADDGRDPAMIAADMALNALSGLTLVAGFDDAALARLEERRRANDSGESGLGVDDSHFQLLIDRAQFDRANNSPLTTPLIDLLAPPAER